MPNGIKRRICDFSSEELTRLWRVHAPDHDDLVDAPNLHQEFTQRSIDEKGFASSRSAMAYWREHEPSFFKSFPYQWVDTPMSYAMPAEAAFQVRTLELLIGARQANLNVPVEDMYGDIAVRETIAPTQVHATPRACSVDGHGFILLPLGWFDTLHFATASLRGLFEGNSESVRSALLEIFARTIADLCVRKLGTKRFPLHPAIHAVLRPGVARSIAEKVTYFGEASGDVQAHALSGLWGDFNYAATTFALAHEASHLLMQEHLSPSNEADEERADELAFQMMLRSEAWRDRLHNIPFRSDAGKTRGAILFFNFINLLRLKADQIVINDQNQSLLNFGQRIASLDRKAATVAIPEVELKELHAMTTWCHALLQAMNSLLQSIDASILSQARDEGLAAGESLIREQAPFGGVPAERPFKFS